MGAFCVLLPNFFFKKSWTILARCGGALSWIKIPVLLFIIQFTSGRNSFSKSFLYVSELTFIPLSLTKNRFVAPFTLHKQKPLPFFNCLLVWWKRQLSWILSFFFKSIVTTVLRIYKNIQNKILFILPYIFFYRTTFPKPIPKLLLFVLLVYLNSSWMSSNIWIALIPFSLSFVLRKYGVYQCFLQPLLVTCGYHDYLIVNRLNFQ